MLEFVYCNLLLFKCKLRECIVFCHADKGVVPHQQVWRQTNKPQRSILITRKAND